MTESPASPADVDRSLAVDEAARLVGRARKVLANGDLAMSARPLLFGGSGVYPQFLAEAEGCRVTDTTGRTYVDWLMGWGSVLLGYRNVAVERAIVGQLGAAAPTLSMPHPLEVEVAERLLDILRSGDMVAFGKNGSDAVTAAVRLARAVTERDVVLQFGFHGFHDWFAADNPNIRGLPHAFGGLTCPFPYNDVGALESLFEQHQGRVAAVVMEPFRTEMPNGDYLSQVRALADRHGALLILDEMMTGFRVSRGGGQELTGVRPDLACYGKALSNGMPLSALVGSRELMRSADSVGVDMTCRGETLSLAAARAALEIYASEPVAETVAQIGRKVRSGIQEEAARFGVPLNVVGHPARLELAFEDLGAVPKLTALGLFIQQCLEHGVIMNGLLLPTPAHDDAAVDATLFGAREGLRMIRLAAERRTRELPPPFGPSSIGFLESAAVVGGELHLSGWILPCGGPPESVEVIDSAGRTAEVDLVLRDDVAKAYPAIPGAARCGWSARIAVDADHGGTWTLRARRNGRVVFRGRLVGGLRTYQRSFPREMRDGHVVEF